MFPSFFVVADIADDDDDKDFDMEECRVFHRYSFVRRLLLLIIGRPKAAFSGNDDDDDDDDDDDEVREQIKAETGTDNVTDVDDKNDMSIIIMIAYTRT